MFGNLALGLLIFCCCCQVSAQEPSEQQRRADIKAVHERVEGYIRAIRQALFGGLTGHDAEIYKEIVFRVTDKDLPSRAGSWPEDGTRIVEIDIGYVREMEMLAEAILIEQEQNRPVLIPYIRYVVFAWRQKATFVKAPTTFAHFDPDKIDKNPKLETLLVAMTLSGMGFVMAHEVAHHVLGDYDKPLPQNPEELRRMEERADAWALKTCVNAKPHFSPMGGVLPLLFDYYTTPSPIQRETHSDHPANLRRIELMFEAMDDALPHFRDDIEQQGTSYEEFRQYIEDSLKSYKEQIQNDAPPVQELRPLATISNPDTGTQ